jgi:cytosine deaminase
VALVLRNALLADGRTVDVTIDATVVTSVTQPSLGAPSGESLDLTGYLLLPAPAEPHAHLDKAFTWDRLPVAYGDLMAAVKAWSAESARIDAADVRRRGLRGLGLLSARGVTAVRTHANICAGGDPLLAMRALVDLREEVAGVIDLEVVLLTRGDTSNTTIREALSHGVDRLGGAPHAWDDPFEGTLRVLRLASEAGVGVDLHVDEDLDPHAATLALIGRETLRLGLQGRVTASHCVSLGIQDADVRDDAVWTLREADVGVVTLPLTNLYLQGRTWATSPPRGLTAVRALIDGGVTLAAGSDNLRDPFNPMGRGDPLEVASMLVMAGHLTVEEAYAAVADGCPPPDRKSGSLRTYWQSALTPSSTPSLRLPRSASSSVTGRSSRVPRPVCGPRSASSKAAAGPSRASGEAPHRPDQPWCAAHPATPAAGAGLASARPC